MQRIPAEKRQEISRQAPGYCTIAYGRRALFDEVTGSRRRSETGGSPGQEKAST
jgi:hypothetical protein